MNSSRENLTECEMHAIWKNIVESLKVAGTKGSIMEPKRQ